MTCVELEFRVLSVFLRCPHFCHSAICLSNYDRTRIFRAARIAVSHVYDSRVLLCTYVLKFYGFLGFLVDLENLY